MDGEQVKPARQLKCSFAITGLQKSFQAVYICRSCLPKDREDEFLCVCQACAESCHQGHDGLEYVGMGQSYCDCREMVGDCSIEKESFDEARLLDIPTSLGHNILITAQHSETTSYVREAYLISSLLGDDDRSRQIRRQAQSLVTYSKQTFWVDGGADEAGLTGLERLALSVFKRHCSHFNLSKEGATAGAEWWVQVKEVSYNSDERKTTQQDVNNEREAIDLHYDKDEAVAESFGLGIFPVLSTVTYLTNSMGAPPTLVLSRRYDQPEEAETEISEIYVSHPRQGKHLVFDGRLLHGAPSHYGFREPRKLEANEVVGEEPRTRITFLVNIWIGHKPARVTSLPQELRSKLDTAVIPDSEFDKVAHDEYVVESEEAFPLGLRSRIRLPFVGKETTWGDEDEEVASMYVLTYPPPTHPSDTFCMRFGAQMGAYIDYADEDDEEDDLEDGS